MDPPLSNNAVQHKPEGDPANDNNTSSKPSPRRNRNGLIFWTTWIAAVLATAASILFGIWAPLSYKATVRGNDENNEVQSSMLSSISVANSIAQAALSTADAQQSQLKAMGQLALVQYCGAHTTDSACSSFLADIPFTSLVSHLASTTAQIPSTTSDGNPPSTQTGSAPQPSPKGSSGGASGISAPAILGIVFGVVSSVGLILAPVVFVWRYRRKQLATLRGRDS